jgi:hypothetical protein
VYKWIGSFDKLYIEEKEMLKNTKGDKYLQQYAFLIK